VRPRPGIAARTDHHATNAQLRRGAGEVRTVPHLAAAARLLCLQSLHPPPHRVQAYAARNRNRGAALCASADLISFIDADDLMLPDRLEVRTVLARTLPLILALTSNPEPTPP
jgi:hypothetical protein